MTFSQIWEARSPSQFRENPAPVRRANGAKFPNSNGGTVSERDTTRSRTLGAASREACVESFRVKETLSLMADSTLDGVFPTAAATISRARVYGVKLGTGG